MKKFFGISSGFILAIVLLAFGLAPAAFAHPGHSSTAESFVYPISEGTSTFGIDIATGSSTSIDSTSLLNPEAKHETAQSKDEIGVIGDSTNGLASGSGVAEITGSTFSMLYEGGGSYQLDEQVWYAFKAWHMAHTSSSAFT